MSVIRAIKMRLGLSVTPANNFVWDASADNGSAKLARESGQDIMTVDAAGKPRFNQLAQLLSGSGYKVLEGGLIIQWRYVSGGTGDTAVVWPIAFPNACFGAVATIQGGVPSAFAYSTTVSLPDTAGCSISRKYVSAGGTIIDAGDTVLVVAIGY